MNSKKERKLRAKQALLNQLEEYQYFHIFHDLDLSKTEWVSLLKLEAKNFNVSVDFQIEDNSTIHIYVPNIDIKSSCFLTLGGHADFPLNVLEDYDGAESDDVLDKLAKMNIVTLSAQRRLNEVINLVFNLSTRLLGRTTKGILADEEQKYIGKDWVAWSCDYYEKDLFKAFNYENLPDKYPAIKKKRLWGLF